MCTKAVCSSPVAANVEDQASALWQANDAWVYILSTCTVAQVCASQHPCVPLYCGTPVFTFWGPAMESRILKRSLCVMAWAGCCPVFGWVLESECGFTKQVELSRRREARARDTIQELLTAGASVCQVRPSVYLSQRCKSFAQQHTP